MLLRSELTPHLCHPSRTIWLFRKSLATETIDYKLAQPDEEAILFQRIRCPLCSWQPTPRDLWVCTDCGPPEYFFAGCGTTWNTFMTRGLCPGCAHQWRYTSCLRCWGLSLHEDWYTADKE